jgi:AGCS family alanine or glycine:cation symporter
MTPTIVSISKDYFKKRDNLEKDGCKNGEKLSYKDGDCEIQGKSEEGIW